MGGGEGRREEVASTVDECFFTLVVLEEMVGGDKNDGGCGMPFAGAWRTRTNMGRSQDQVFELCTVYSAQESSSLLFVCRRRVARANTL